MVPRMALTDKQKSFIAGITRGLTLTAAAREAGYSDASPHALRVAASRTMSLPEVQAAAHAAREKKLQGPLAEKAIACLESIITSETAPAASRVQASRWILEAGGHGIESRRLAARLDDGGDVAPHRMSLEALEVAAGLALRHVEQEREAAAVAAAVEAEIIGE